MLKRQHAEYVRQTWFSFMLQYLYQFQPAGRSEIEFLDRRPDRHAARSLDGGSTRHEPPSEDGLDGRDSGAGEGLERRGSGQKQVWNSSEARDEQQNTGTTKGEVQHWTQIFGRDDQRKSVTTEGVENLQDLLVEETTQNSDQEHSEMEREELYQESTTAPLQEEVPRKEETIDSRNSGKDLIQPSADTVESRQNVDEKEELLQSSGKQAAEEELDYSENDLSDAPLQTEEAGPPDAGTVDDAQPIRRGVLRVRITEFLNPSNKDADGDCCMEYSEDSTCRGYCRLFFRVCATHSSRNVLFAEPATPPTSAPAPFLPTVSAVEEEPTPPPSSRNLFTMPSLEAVRHKMISNRRIGSLSDAGRDEGSDYQGRGIFGAKSKRAEDQRNFNPNVPCTLGLIVTEVVANSSLRADVEGALDISFPFTSDWPVSFRIIVEAWHDVTGFLFNSSKDVKSAERAGALVARHASRLTVPAGQAWQTRRRVMNHAASILYGVRVLCSPPFTGAKCIKSHVSAKPLEDALFADNRLVILQSPAVE